MENDGFACGIVLPFEAASLELIAETVAPERRRAVRLAPFAV